MLVLEISRPSAGARAVKAVMLCRVVHVAATKVLNVDCELLFPPPLSFIPAIHMTGACTNHACTNVIDSFYV
jgi:hypothetical protein